MLWSIARAELSLQLRDGRLVLAALALLAALLAAAVTGWVQFERSEAERTHFVAEAREQWLNQGERHPHRAAHFGAYVAKPELSLAMFEPGLRPFAGQTLWLEAHDRPAFANIPSEDDLTLGTGLGVVSGSTILQMLGGLLALVMASLAIVRERETGVLRQILAQGISPAIWVGGKLLGLAAALAIPLAPAALVALTGTIVAAPAAERVNVALRSLGLIGADALLLVTLLMIGLAISALSRSSRAALIAALALWAATFVLAPRAAATLAERLAPTPTIEQYYNVVKEEFGNGFDARGGYMKQLAALEQATLKQYGVAKLDDLPTGFSGIRMKHLDAWSAEVDNREFARLEATYARQGGIRLGVSLLAPFVAARSVSQGMAGMDWAHYRDFLKAAERYRRAFGSQMNELLQSRVRGARWETDGTNVDWARVAPFAYANPAASFAFHAQAGFLAVLLGWLLLAAAGLTLTTRRLRP